MAKVRTRKRGNTYSYIFEAGKTPEGKRKVIEKGGFATEDEAYDAGIDAYADWKHGGIGIKSENITVQELLDVWHEKRKPELAVSTSYMYSGRIKKINSIIGSKHIQDLKPRDVDAMVTKLVKDGYSYSYVKQMKSILSLALSYAVYPAELLRYNPAAEIHIPRNAKKDIVKRHVVTPEKFGEAMKTYPLGHCVHMLLFIAYHTGMRVGEICGLTWDAVNLDKRTITVRKQLICVNKIHYFKNLKTKSSSRSIYIDSELYDELIRWKAMQEQNALELGNGYKRCFHDKDGILTVASSSVNMGKLTELKLITTYKDGRPMTPFRSARYISLLGLNSHSFRHTHATMLAEANVNPKEVAARLGHKKINITMELYTKATDQMLKHTSDEFEKMLSKQANNQTSEQAKTGSKNADKTANADKTQTNQNSD